MVRPERRTKADVTAAAVIALVVAAAAALIWWTSDARATSSHPADVPLAEPTPARDVPDTLTLRWTAPSPVTSGPVVIGGAVVTGAGHQMTGRDPATGEPRWSYARGRDLCGVSWIYHDAVAVYPDSRGCGQVSTVDAATGMRGPARTSYADDHVTLSSDGDTVLSAGPTRLELWRYDMVRVLSYGEIDARVKPESQGVGTGCALRSAAAGSSTVSVLEACPGHADLRLTLLRPQSGKDEDEPEVRYVPQPGVGVDSAAAVLAVSGNNTAVYLPTPHPHVDVLDASGTVLSSTLLPKPASTSHAVTRADGVISWWTGDAVLVFDSATLTYRFTVSAVGPAVPLGPATTMAGRLLIPVTGGVGVYDAITGDFKRFLTVSRPPVDGAVVPAVSGALVLEQRGDTVVALG